MMTKRCRVTGNKIQWRDAEGKLHVHVNNEVAEIPVEVFEREWRNVKEIILPRDFPRANTAMAKGQAETRAARARSK